ncbi:MAG: H-NS histone family protein [Paramuribaculum sp.]|nr:H-NS histone family protein [Paramuribaculum sp.]
MKNYILASFIILLCFSSCIKSSEEIRNEKIQEFEEKIQEIEKVIATRGGNIIGEATRWDASNEPETRIVYTLGDTLFCWNPRSEEPNKLFNNLDQLLVYEFSIDFLKSGAVVKHSVSPIRKVNAPSYDEESGSDIIVNATDIFKSDNVTNLYHMAGEWIFIGGDFVVNVYEPNKLIDIANFDIDQVEQRFNTKLTQTRWVSSDAWTGYIECDLANDALSISLYGENHQLPGFSTYRHNMPDYEWSFGGSTWSEERYKDDYHFRADIEIEGSPDDVKFEGIYWRQSKFRPEEMTAIRLQKVYMQREEEVLKQIEEDREKEKQDKIQRIKEQAISFDELAEAYYGNTAYGKQTYPTGRNYILKVGFDEILRSNISNYSYRFKDHITILKRGYFYSNDHTFASIKFPFSGYVSGYFDSYSKEYVLLSDEVYEMTFYFTNVEPLLWY